MSTWNNATEVHVTVEDACGLTATSMINVSIDVPELIVELEDEYEVSCNVPFSITPDWSGGQPFYNWGWLEGFSFLGFSETLNWTTDQDMSITLEVSDGCGQFVTATTEVIVVSPPLEVTLPDTLVGPCTETFSLSPGIDGGSGVYTYEWTQNLNPVGVEATFQYSDGLPTTFAVEVTDNCQSSGSATSTIVIDNPPLVVDLPDTINASCIDNTVIAVDIESGAGEYTYEWSVGGIPYGGSDPQITVQSFVTTPIFVEVQDGCGGEDDTAATLVIPDVPMTLSVPNDTVICRGESLSLEVATGVGRIVFSSPGFRPWRSPICLSSNSFSYPARDRHLRGDAHRDRQRRGAIRLQRLLHRYLSDTRIEFIATPEPACPTCDFDWNFGDGATSEEPNPIHEYDGLGDYYACSP